MRVVTENVSGNMHSAGEWLNKYNLGRFLRQMDTVGNYTIVVMVMTDEEFEFYDRHMKMKAAVSWTMSD